MKGINNYCPCIMEVKRHLGLCLGYVPAFADGSCRVSDQDTNMQASDLHNAHANILIIPLYGSVLVSWFAKNRHILTAPEHLLTAPEHL